LKWGKTLSDKPAILGGDPLHPDPLSPYITIGEEEKQAVMEVMDTGVLSHFYGSVSPQFWGGPKVREFEQAWCKRFGVAHSVAVNSATSALMTAVGAIGVGPGDEVIVSPYTMSSSASCVLVYNAIPVFADVDPDTFCLDPESIRACITPRTKAIVIVHIFGHPADMDAIMDIAKEYNLKVIEDAAQSPGALYKGRETGTIGDIGVFSLNCHKVIQTGEGGVFTTNNEELALRAQLIRNHAEAVVGPMGIENIVNMLGWNYRMTEIDAAIGIEQLKKLDSLTDARIHLTNRLTDQLSKLQGIIPPLVRPEARHVYYVYAVKVDSRQCGISRDLLVKALSMEGIPFWAGYTEPLYLQPMYQKRIVYGKNGCPFTCSHYEGNVSYERGICPVVECLYDTELLLTEVCRPPLTDQDLDLFVTAFKRILAHADEIGAQALLNA
jgi:perosamine synthetase